MVWTLQHEEILVREIYTYEPYNHKSGTTQRGESWKLIADTLNTLDNPKFTVTHRAVRERYGLMEKNFKRKKADEEKATGIAPVEGTEFEVAMEDIVSKFEEIELLTLKEREENNQAAEKERETATEMRRQCMETHSETTKRKGDESATESNSNTKRTRRSGDDTLCFMREKMNIDKTLREKELEIAAKREENLQKLLDQQQKQNQAMLQLLMARDTKKQ